MFPHELLYNSYDLYYQVSLLSNTEILMRPHPGISIHLTQQSSEFFTIFSFKSEENRSPLWPAALSLLRPSGFNSIRFDSRWPRNNARLNLWRESEAISCLSSTTIYGSDSENSGAIYHRRKWSSIKLLRRDLSILYMKYIEFDPNTNRSLIECHIISSVFNVSRL